MDWNVCFASGDGANLIYVDMDDRIAVGVTGTFKPRIFNRIDFVERHVLALYPVPLPCSPSSDPQP